MYLLDSGLCGDVYYYTKGVKEYVMKLCPSEEYNLNYEIEILKKLKNCYGIPILYNIKTFKNITFHGKYGNGVLCNQNVINKGDGTGLVMNYCGQLSLDNLHEVSDYQVDKILFNAFYILYNIYNMGFFHNDVHRKNFVIQEVKSHQKTYYIGKYKYILKNQKYKVTLVDFGTVTQSNQDDSASELDDVIFLNGHLKDIHKYNVYDFDCFETFFKHNFNLFIT